MPEIITRRAHLNEVGEPLLLPRDPVVLMSRFGAFGEESNIVASDLRISPLVSSPMVRSGFSVRGSGVSPEILFHPLLWIPERLQMRDGESLDHWMVRVAVEYSANGVYQVEDGSWYDVMAHCGISVDYPDGIARITRWLDGESDSVLDSFDMDSLLSHEDEGWSFEAASDLLPDMELASVHYMSTSIAQMFAEASDPDDPYFAEHPGERGKVASIAAMAAHSMLATVADEYGVDFDQAHRALATMSDEQIIAPGSHAELAATMLRQIADETAEHEQRLAETFTEAFGANPSEADFDGDEDEPEQS